MSIWQFLFHFLIDCVGSIYPTENIFWKLNFVCVEFQHFPKNIENFLYFSKNIFFDLRTFLFRLIKSSINKTLKIFYFSEKMFFDLRTLFLISLLAGRDIKIVFCGFACIRANHGPVITCVYFQLDRTKSYFLMSIWLHVECVKLEFMWE